MYQQFLIQFSELSNQIIANPMNSLFIILSIILIEVILSFDNSAVLAVMVKDLPEEQSKKALHYGIWGAFIFRGLALLFVSFLIKVWWLKSIGGLYLIWMCYNYFKGASTETTDDDVFDKKGSWIYRNTVGVLGVFWSTVCLVELMDLSFSIDNIFAVAAFSNNIILICFGVFIGIVAMRYVAQGFMSLMKKYSFLEKCAFIVIGLLGIKLSISFPVHFFPSLKWLESETADIVMSALTLSIFFIPILVHKFRTRKLKTT